MHLNAPTERNQFSPHNEVLCKRTNAIKDRRAINAKCRRRNVDLFFFCLTARRAVAPKEVDTNKHTRRLMAVMRTRFVLNAN